VLLIAFYFFGTTATKVKHDVKSRLTLSSTGAGGGEGARTATQVLANSLVASILTLAHAIRLSRARESGDERCFSDSLLVLGIIGNYAATTADTLSSELGILSRSAPRLITTLRRCPPGTNGGVSGAGLLAGAGGAAAIGITSLLLLPFCEDAWSLPQKLGLLAFITAVGTAGSLLDSLLGALLQASVVDVRSGKVVEAPGGKKVLVTPPGNDGADDGGARKRVGGASKAPAPATGAEVGVAGSRKVLVGRDVLSNNGVNLLMAALTSVGAMVVSAYWRGDGVGAVVREALGW